MSKTLQPKPHKAQFRDGSATEAATAYAKKAGGYVPSDGPGFRVRWDAFLAGCQWHRENCCEASRRKDGKDG